MAEKDDEWHLGMRLVLELDSILEFDPYIDELGFVHASQLESLHSLEPFALDHERPFFMKTRRKPDGRGESSEDSIEYAEDVSQRSDGQEVEAEQPGTNPDQSYYLDSVQRGAIDFSYDKSAFWCCHHKLAIAERALAPIFNVAKKEFFANRKAYTTWMAGGTRSSSSTHATTSLSNQLSDISLENGYADGDSKIVNMDARNEETALQKNLMLYTRVLVIVNSDFASAWNARKRILSRIEATEASLLAELRLAGMVLAFGPKSEESWAHRRWIINRMFAGDMCWKTLGSVLEGDSMLVEVIAGRSTMNYRAWRHRYWLVSRMTLKQALSELQDSKRWAQSHVADNCCFHYRRCLLLGLLQAGSTPDRKIVSGPTQADSTAQANFSSAFSINSQNLTTLWKEEFSWNKDLIERYVGREALWLHRRFLVWGFSHYSEFFEPILISVKPSSCDNTSSFEGEECSQRAAQLAKRELQFADACIAACRVDSLDDASRQREYAAAYKLRLFWLYNEGKDDGKHGVLELKSLELLLKETSPHRECLWNGLVPNLGLSS